MSLQDENCKLSGITKTRSLQENRRLLFYEKKHCLQENPKRYSEHPATPHERQL